MLGSVWLDQRNLLFLKKPTKMNLFNLMLLNFVIISIFFCLVQPFDDELDHVYELACRINCKEGYDLDSDYPDCYKRCCERHNVTFCNPKSRL